MRTNPDALCQFGRDVIRTEIHNLEPLIGRIDHFFTQACELILQCKGRIVVTGMGKSGHVAGKIAATMASTGTPAFFVHPGEAGHGDLGMIQKGDVLVMLSNSGSTSEIMTLLPRIKRLGVKTIALTGNPDSILATSATVHLDVSVNQEACPLGLAPTSSSTAALVMGDALAISLLQARGFTSEDFACSHPSGKLGRRLLLHVSDIMRTGDAIPKVDHTALLPDALYEMTHKRLGMTTVVDEHDRLLGIYTDGDLRRTMQSSTALGQFKIKDIMTCSPKTIAPNELALDCVEIMEECKITALVVLENEHVAGVVHLHDLFQAGVM